MEQDTKTKFCKDCRWCWGPGEGFRHQSEQWTCESPNNSENTVSVVTGEHHSKYDNCYDARLASDVSSNGEPIGCQEEGLWFEPKETLAQKIIKESQPRLPKGKGFEIGKDI